MDEEMLKRRTDCVFFLASPLTCKKGVECEYRHSEIARLNLRDCWYWLAGNCLNPACGFRHPPLDLHNEAMLESSVSHQSSSTVKKTNAPCYFYYNGFCNKGNTCHFSHGPDWCSPPTSNPLKDNSTVTRCPLSNNDPIVRKVIESNPAERKITFSRTVPKAIVESQPASGNILKPHEPSENCVAMIEVASTDGSGSRSFLPVDLTSQRTRVSTNQSLEQQVVTEKSWKASPGFHIFANGDDSENLYCEDDQEEYSPRYVQHMNELISPLSGYDFELPGEYDPMKHEAEIFCGYGVYDCGRNSDSPHSLDDAGTVQDELSGEAPDRLWSAERDLLHMEVEVGDCPNVADLREHLQCMGKEEGSASWILRRGYSSCSNGYRRTRPGRNRFSQRLHRKLITLRGKNPVGSVKDYGFSFNVIRKRGVHRHLGVQNFRKYKGKRQVCATGAPGGRRSHQEEGMAFAGPKTLDQIKGEQMRAACNNVNEDSDSDGCSRFNSMVDFQGPKPLSELLKNKRCMETLPSCGGEA
ncbi:hypothetical protein SAY86_002840 [Trapa natans]|uniref:C3H1-type domain-containing protein n=1 Tax=Trapa natans TaxID=22666 RepID=A0AAN7R3S4_TRANT|nr:hypothetical protein SAY86_002840 [Trapa natans]